MCTEKQICPRWILALTRVRENIANSLEAYTAEETDIGECGVMAKVQTALALINAINDICNPQK